MWRADLFVEWWILAIWVCWCGFLFGFVLVVVVVL